MRNNPVYLNFRDLWDLYGPSYEIIKDAVFYSTICHANRYKPLFFGKQKIDQRFNLFFVMPSGSGKKDIFAFFNKSIRRMNTCNCKTPQCVVNTHIHETFANCQRPHADHLIGKKLLEWVPNPQYRRGTGQPKHIQHVVSNYGYLHNSFCAFDECHSIITEKDKEDIRQYLRIATDPFQRNELVKQRVDVSFDAPLKYYPECSLAFFMQPHPIDQEVVTAGLLRRGVIIYVEPTLKEMLDGINHKFTHGITFTQAQLSNKWDRWIKFLRQCRTGTDIKTFEQGVVHFTFSKAVYQKIIEESDAIVHHLIYQSTGATRYLNQSMISDIKKNLMRMACVHATIVKRKDIHEQDVELSAIDLKKFCLSANEFVENYVETKVLLKEELQEILLYLADQGATNKKSAIPTALFLDTFSKLTRKSITFIKRNQLRILLSRGYIRTVRGRRGGVCLTPEGARYAGITVKKTSTP